ncbi:MAG: hypothetical protein ACI4LO_01255 [Anaerovoracaceae bacterium]
MKEKIWKTLLVINLFIAFTAYLPIFVPADFYMRAYDFLFGVMAVNLAALFLIRYVLQVIDDKE